MPLDDVGAFYVTQRPILTKNYREGTQSATRLRNAHMSALGQKQTCAAQKVMSALPPKADMCSALGDVR